QQISEGFLWLSIGDATCRTMYTIAMCAFLLFAQVVWPIWVPFSIRLLERNEKRKKILTALLVMGIMAGGYLGVCLLLFNSTANTAGNHIEYALDFPKTLEIPAAILYFAPIVIAPFVSTVKRMQFLAIVAFLAYAVSQLFFTQYLISVWCFFAAIISIVVIWVEWRLQSRRKREELMRKIKFSKPD
ncbi:MAG TPA: DUF6629 family protein, partial [Bacteroidia bacterium]|nr:DUF6629 family protein [Bacteroidia bacterium]